MNTSEELDVLTHVVINVSDLEISKNWYLTSFKCKLIYQDAKHIRLRFKNTDLILTLPSQERHHLGYKKENAETFGELLEKNDGRKSCFIADPTGNPVELVK